MNSNNSNNYVRSYKVPFKALNPLNQFYHDKFLHLKRQADFRSNRGLSHCYRRILMALSKYPLPILKPEQALTLDGCGDMVAKRFSHFMEERSSTFLAEQSDLLHERKRLSRFATKK